MKILIIRNYPNYMDVRHNTYNIQEIGLAKSLIRRNHVCDIVFWGEKEETVDVAFDDDKHIKIYYKTGKNILKNAFYNRLDTLIAQYDIIQPCEYNQLQSWLLAKKYPNKTIIYHGPYYCASNKGYNTFCKVFDIFFLNSYRKRNTPFIVKSELAFKFLSKKGISNISTVGVGIDLGALSVTQDKVPEFIEQVEHTPDTINLLYIGRLEPRRNIPFIYGVAATIKQRGNKVKLIMVGKGNKDYLQICQETEEKFSLSDTIQKVEKLEQKYLSKLYAKCDFFVLPTRYEIFGMVLLEAMYYGLVSLTTKNGGSDVLIANNENGYVLPLDVDKWADIIIKLHNDKVTYEKISQASHKKIAEEYTWDALAERFEKAYDSVIK